ncbi:MAG TPA: shikimate kinase, partial [Ktedonobacteraceae bacterium]|nr:shikimate kinase [Ktedonobacteraceae bacterium]
MHNIFLIGLSGSGKSTIGRMLAERLGKPFIDIDALIEQTCGERISTIFARHGEDYFRDCESRLFARIVQEEHAAVVSTGGGIVVRPENRALLRGLGVSIYLSLDPKTALERLKLQQAQILAAGESPEIRPLLAKADPLAALQDLLATRAEWYGDAHYTCLTSGKSPEQVTQELIAMLVATGELSGIPPILRHLHV